MFLYTILEAAVAVIAGILLAACSKKAEDVTYTKLDKAGRITNILLTVLYICCAPVVMFLGIISYPDHTGLLGILGWIVCILNASAVLFSGLGLGFSVALRKKGKSKQSFAVQFVGVAAMAFTVVSYILFAGNLLSPLN